MLKKIFAAFCFSLVFINAFAQKNISRPKLVVGLIVDQMRWDYLYRYYDRYGNDGFKRLLNNGFSCENTLINHIPSYTAVGHSTIFTGSVPAIDGISGNDWIEQLSGKLVYCTDDANVQPVGNPFAREGKMSPRNLLVTTITDELRLATNYQSKVVGISLKDRASILPAGHLANAAFWLDDASGNFITSTYYMNQLPEWVNKFNDKKRIKSLIENGWNTLYPVNTYKESDEDAQSYEGLFSEETSSVFPHDIKKEYEKKRSIFRSTPFGNTLTLEFSNEAIDGYSLGKGNATDFLTINLASTDYVGHMYGINAIEIEDTYLRLDKELGDFFKMLDAKIGKGQWLLFLTADHGAANSVGYSQSHNIPADVWVTNALTDSLNKFLSIKFHASKLVRSIKNYQVNFDLNKIDADGLDIDAIKKMSVDYLQRQPGILFAADMAAIGRVPIPEKIKNMMINGYYFKRSGQIQIILNSGMYEGSSKTGTTHGTWNPYDTHIPLLWFGWNIMQGKTNREIYMTDIAPTLAAMLHVQMPSGCIGKVIEELSK